MNAYFSALPPDVRQQGICKFANRLPAASQGLIRRLFERHTPNLLKPVLTVNPDAINEGTHQKILNDLDKWRSTTESNPAQAIGGRFDTMIIERSISRKRGAWVLIGPEIPDDPTGAP